MLLQASKQATLIAVLSKGIIFSFLYSFTEIIFTFISALKQIPLDKCPGGICAGAECSTLADASEPRRCGRLQVRSVPQTAQRSRRRCFRQT